MLEIDNADFFREYDIRLLLKKHILLFNDLLEKQSKLMKYSTPAEVPLTPGKLSLLNFVEFSKHVEFKNAAGISINQNTPSLL